MRRQLCDEHVAVENQAAHLEDAMLRRLSKRRLIRLEADIRLLDKRLAEMVATNAAFAQPYELLTSMPGVGPVLAFTLIALLPELGKMSRKQIAALVGLATYDFDSGKLRDTEVSTVVGCRSVMSSTWQPSAQADTIPLSRPSPTVLPTPTRNPRSSSSPSCEKMITTLNAMLRDNAAWQPQSN